MKIKKSTTVGEWEVSSRVFGKWFVTSGKDKVALIEECFVKIQWQFPELFITEI